MIVKYQYDEELALIDFVVYALLMIAMQAMNHSDFWTKVSFANA
jgi:hypothetical protein